MKFFKNSLIVFMAILVFITSSGFTVNLHYCAGKLANVEFLDGHANCMMHQIAKKTATAACEKTIHKKRSCCQDRKIVAKSDNKTIVSKTHEDNTLLKTFAFINFYTPAFSLVPNHKVVNDQLEGMLVPPLIKENIYVLLQNFRN